MQRRPLNAAQRVKKIFDTLTGVFQALKKLEKRFD